MAATHVDSKGLAVPFRLFAAWRLRCTSPATAQRCPPAEVCGDHGLEFLQAPDGLLIRWYLYFRQHYRAMAALPLATTSSPGSSDAPREGESATLRPSCIPLPPRLPATRFATHYPGLRRHP